ncbi:hypothetical protein N7490_009617 [Penicillium lividum]|nr:hypothetical protein N7490_009617 [Penicillium lividum]
MKFFTALLKMAAFASLVNLSSAEWEVKICRDTDCSDCNVHTGASGTGSGCINTDITVKSFIIESFGENTYFDATTVQDCSDDDTTSYDTLDLKYCYNNKYTIKSWLLGGA